jgi:general secretion pathway protein D
MRFNKILVILFLVLSLFAHAENNHKNNRVNLELKNLNISDFLEMVSKITKKNILIEGEVKGKINFISSKPIKKSEIIPLANAILESKKMTLVDKGDYYQVVKSNDAAGEGLPVENRINPNIGTMQTVVFRLNKANTAIIKGKIRSLLHKNAKAVAFKKNNILAVTAYPRTLEAIKKLIDQIEHGENKISRVVTLQNAYVKNIYPNIQMMARDLFPQDITSERVSVIKDENANSLILIGKRANINKLEKYIRELDIKGEEIDAQRMYVIPLKNSNVEEMEKILSKLLPQMTGNLATSGSINAISKGKKVPINQTPTSHNSSSSSVPRQNKKIKKAVIASDLERNALIVLANSAQIENIRNTIKLLDIEKAQVYIQAKIVEVNTNLAENVGLKYGFNGGAITSNGVFSLLSSSGAAPLAISSELMNFLNNGTTTYYDSEGHPTITETDNNFKFDAGIKEVFSMGLQLDLLKQNGAAQILSEPSVLCTNNKESTIYVGQTQSILTQSQQSTQSASNIINNYSREDIGITLKVKPRLSSNNKVSLEVETTIEDIVPGSGTTADRPTTTKRSVKTNAIVNHGQTIILGGLIKTSTGKSSTKIPILGDIPILGKLFTSKGESKSKINVVIYLTPYIIKKSTDLVTLRKNLEELDSIQEKFNRIVLDKLEKRRRGIEEEKTHITFSTKPDKFLKEVPADGLEESPIIPENKPAKQIQQETNNVINTTQDEYQDYQTQEPIVYDEEMQNEDAGVVRSESILDSINQQNKNINLDQINTGIEYNDGTVFEDDDYN